MTYCWCCKQCKTYINILTFLKDFFSLYILTLIRFRLSVLLLIGCRSFQLPAAAAPATSGQMGLLSPPARRFIAPPTHSHLQRYPSPPLTPFNPDVSLKLVTGGEGRWLKRRAFAFALSCFPPSLFSLCPSLVFSSAAFRSRLQREPPNRDPIGP